MINLRRRSFTRSDIGSRVSSDTNVHVLHDQVSRAVVDEATAHVFVVEQRAKLRDQLLLAVSLKDQVLMRLNHCKTLIECRCPVLVAHEGLELRELARRNVDHLLLADVACHVAILAYVVDSNILGGGLRLEAICLFHTLNVVLVAVVTDL
jgi:hypothetical protein